MARIRIGLREARIGASGAHVASVMVDECLVEVELSSGLGGLIKVRHPIVVGVRIMVCAVSRHLFRLSVEVVV